MQTLDTDKSKNWMNNPKIKNMTTSTIFEEEPEKKVTKRKCLSAFKGTGDIFTWKDTKVEKTKININKRDPNYNIGKEETFSPSKSKFNKMAMTSKENCLSSYQ